MIDIHNEEYCSLGLEDFLEKYKEDILKGNITEEAKNDAIKALLDEEEYKKMCYKSAIRSIYDAVLAIKYFNDEYPDVGMIAKIISGTMFMMQHGVDNGIDHYDIPGICDELYKEYKEENPKYLKEDKMPDEFKPYHLCDIEYYLKKFKEWSHGEKDFNDALEKDLWRFIRNANI